MQRSSSNRPRRKIGAGKGGSPGRHTVERATPRHTHTQYLSKGRKTVTTRALRLYFQSNLNLEHICRGTQCVQWVAQPGPAQRHGSEGRRPAAVRLRHPDRTPFIRLTTGFGLGLRLRKNGYALSGVDGLRTGPPTGDRDRPRRSTAAASGGGGGGSESGEPANRTAGSAPDNMTRKSARAHARARGLFSLSRTSPKCQWRRPLSSIRAAPFLHHRFFDDRYRHQCSRGVAETAPVKEPKPARLGHC